MHTPTSTRTSKYKQQSHSTILYQNGSVLLYMQSGKITISFPPYSSSLWHHEAYKTTKTLGTRFSRAKHCFQNSSSTFDLFSCPECCHSRNFFIPKQKPTWWHGVILYSPLHVSTVARNPNHELQFRHFPKMWESAFKHRQGLFSRPKKSYLHVSLLKVVVDTF